MSFTAIVFQSPSRKTYFSVPNLCKTIKILLLALWILNMWIWRKPPRQVSYKRTFVAPDQGQMLDMWESQTTESALGRHTCYIASCHILELTLEVILEHVLGIKTMTFLILDHVAIAYLYLGINTGEKVMILFLVIVLELSQDLSWSIKHSPQSFLL